MRLGCNVGTPASPRFRLSGAVDYKRAMPQILWIYLAKPVTYNKPISMTVKPRHPLLVALFLSLAASGCVTNATRFGASEDKRDSSSVTTATSFDEVASGPVTVPSPSDATVGPVAGNSSNGLGPRADSERVGEGLIAYAAFYGPGFKQTADQGGVFLLLIGGRLNLPLLVNKQVTDLEHMTVTANPEPGLQIRLIHEFSDASGLRRFRSCDTMTGPVQPDGHNAAFTGLNLGEGGIIHLFLVNPGASVLIPTADFSATCVDLSDVARRTYILDDMIVGGERYGPLGTLQLMTTIDLAPTQKTDIGSPGIIHLLPDGALY